MDKNYFWKYSFPMKKGEFENEYYFYENNQILHVYDKSKIKVNIEKHVSPSDIPEREKLEMIEKCPEEFKEQIINILTIIDKS